MSATTQELALDSRYRSERCGRTVSSSTTIRSTPIARWPSRCIAPYPVKASPIGWAIATLVDTTGQGIAAICPKELAEYYRERFEQTYGLTSTIDAV